MDFNLNSTDEEVIERIRKDMIVADSSLKPRRAMYELEEYHAKHPQSTDARSDVVDVIRK
ncbi:MAG: hypothetical protein GY797_04650 [Deltaproteobacteria bacterium]|nr:hypothetical protein [Deltaproteobacteria bacterium]